MTDTDPTDHALATIASILDPEETRKPAPSSRQDKSVADAPASPPPLPEEPLAIPEDADGYSRSGPGPLDAVRFKWTVRRTDSGEHFVDETAGGGAPIVIGPMDKEAAVRLVHERERAARERFERLRAEMISGADTAELLGLGGS